MACRQPRPGKGILPPGPADSGGDRSLLPESATGMPPTSVHALQDARADAGVEPSSTPYDRLCALVSEDLAQLDDLLAKRLSSRNEPLINEVARRLVDAGGKRIRPLLTLAAARHFSYAGDRHLLLAAAVELLHSAMLLHDDVVDTSSLRRGIGAAHTIWGNKTSILVGDFLFGRSFELMVACGSLPTLEILAEAAATIAEGEVMQLSTARDLDVADDRYIEVLRAKTSAMFGAAAEVGASIAGAEPETLRAFRDYGLAFGTAFQLADDALDYDGTMADIGKGVGDDFNEGKATMPALIAYRRGSESERRFWRRTIVEGERREDDLATALALTAKTKGAEATRRMAGDWAETASNALAPLPASPVRRLLADLAAYTVARRN